MRTTRWRSFRVSRIGFHHCEEHPKQCKRTIGAPSGPGPVAGESKTWRSTEDAVSILPPSAVTSAGLVWLSRTSALTIPSAIRTTRTSRATLMARRTSARLDLGGGETQFLGVIGQRPDHDGDVLS